MTIEQVRDRLRNRNFQFGKYDRLEAHTAELFHVSGPQPWADELNTLLVATFYLEINILSPQFNDWRAIEDAGFEIVQKMTTMSTRMFWFKPKTGNL